jgi:AcrR family transcriptional regulator
MPQEGNWREAREQITGARFRRGFHNHAEEVALSAVPRIRAQSIQAHKELTRREILDAVHHLLGEVGSADISLSEVAHAVGIGRTTLYEYFKDKDDLIASLVEDRLPEVLEDLVGEVTADDPRERLAALAVITVRFVVSDPVLGLILHREAPLLSTAAQDRIRMAHSDLAAEMVAAYRRGVATGVFRAIAPDIVGRFLQDTIMSAARVTIATADPVARFPEVEAELTRFLIGGLSV